MRGAICDLLYKVVVCMFGKGADKRETTTPVHEEYSTENTTRKEKQGMENGREKRKTKELESETRDREQGCKTVPDTNPLTNVELRKTHFRGKFPPQRHTHTHTH